MGRSKSSYKKKNRRLAQRKVVRKRLTKNNPLVLDDTNIEILDDNKARNLSPESPVASTSTFEMKKTLAVGKSISLDIDQEEKKFETTKITLEGRRVVDAQYLIQQVLNFPHHGLFNCHGANVDITKEVKKGLHSKFFLRCNMCQVTSCINSENPQKKTFHVNTSTVNGAIGIGIGSSQLAELLSSMDIPPISDRMYREIQNDLFDFYNEAAWTAMLEAGQEEATLARENGEVDKSGYPLIVVVADGSWAKRSYKTNYNSNSGVAIFL